MPIRLQVLGGLRATDDDAPFDWVPGQRVRSALLVYLALERQATREQLAHLFWPDDELDHARHVLSQTLYLLRRELGSGQIEHQGEVIRFSTPVECDAQQFEAAAERGDHAVALELYKGAFLKAVSLCPSREFEAWVDRERARYARLLRRACRQGIEALLGEHRLPEAIEVARAWVAVEPIEDEAQHRLIELLAAGGQRSEALQQYQFYEKLLAADKLEPLDETKALVASLRTGSITNAGAAPKRAGAGALVEHSAVPVVIPPVAIPPGAGTARSRCWRSRRAVRAAGAAVALLGAIAAALVVTRWPGTGPAGESVSVVLADMDNLTPDTTLGIVLTEALRVALQQSRVVRLVDVEDVQQFLALMVRPVEVRLDRETALEVARRAGAEVLLTSTIGSVGPGYVLTANLVTAASGRTDATFRVDAPTAVAARAAAQRNELISAIDRLSDQVRRNLGESARQIRATPPLEQVTTSSFEALTLYTSARRLMANPAASERVRSLLRQAVRVDTTFGEAYRALSLRLYYAGRRDSVAPYLTMAYRYRDRMSEVERHLTEGFYHLLITGDHERALTAFNTAAELTSGSERLRFGAMDQLVIIYFAKRDYASAEAWSRHRALHSAEQQPPLRAYTWWRWARTLAAQGKWEEAAPLAEQMDSIYPEWPETLAALFNVAYGLNGVAAADSTARAWARRPASGDGSAVAPFVNYCLAELAVVEGRLRDAERLLRRARDPQPWQGLVRTSVGANEVLAFANLEVRRDPEAALRSLETVEFRPRWDSTSPIDRRYEWLVQVLARGGHTGEARALLAEYDTAVPDSLRNLAYAEMAMGWPRGELALEEDHPDDAVRYFLDFHRKAGYCAACILPELGRAYEAAGQPDSAVAAYERYLRKEADLDRAFWDGAYLVAVLERLAYLRERSGDARGAAECYRRIVALWERADPELQPRVRYARERLLALSPEHRAAFDTAQPGVPPAPPPRRDN